MAIRPGCMGHRYLDGFRRHHRIDATFAKRPSRVSFLERLLAVELLADLPVLQFKGPGVGISVALTNAGNLGDWSFGDCNAVGRCRKGRRRSGVPRSLWRAGRQPPALICSKLGDGRRYGLERAQQLSRWQARDLR